MNSASATANVKPAPQDDGRKATVRELVDRGLKASTPDEALRFFEQAHRLDFSDPLAMSYHGMALATVRGAYQQGIVFCEEAVRRLGPNPVLLVNLARAYVAACNKREAVRCLRRALASSGGKDEGAVAELVKLGLRRRPVIPFLPRSFPLNRFLGRLRHRFFYARQQADDGLNPVPAELGRLSGSVADAQRALEAAKPESSSGAHE